MIKIASKFYDVISNAYPAIGETNYSKGRFRIITKDTRRIRVEHEFRLITPNFDAEEWIFHISEASSYEAQKNTTTEAQISGTEVRFKRDQEDSILKRFIRSAYMTVANNHHIHSVDILTVYHTTPIRRVLVRGQATEKIEPLTKQEKQWYTASTSTLDYDSSMMIHWIKHNGLIRKTNESDLAFAYRVLLYIKNNFYWIDVKEHDPGHRASRVCQSMCGDCAKLSLVYTSVLRYNHVPTRIIGIRWIPTGAGHIMTEFFTPSIGWVPVDVLVDKKGENYFSTKGKREGFGSTNSDYFVHYIDDGFKLKTFDGFAEILGLHSVAWYAKGKGSFKGMKIDEQWTMWR